MTMQLPRKTDGTQSSPTDKKMENGQASAGGPPEGSGRDAERSALRQLVELSTQCAAAESEIERRRATETAGAKKQFDKAAVQIEQKFAADIAAAEERHKLVLDQVEERYRAGSASIASLEENSRAKIEAEFDPVLRKVKQKLDHDSWLAESVFEVSQNQVKAELKTARDEQQKSMEALDALLAEAKATLVKYHQKPAEPPAPAAGEPAATVADAEAASTAGREQAERYVRNLRRLTIPGLFAGSMPYLVGIALVAVGGIAGWFIGGGSVVAALGGAGGAAVIGVGLGAVLWSMGKGQVREAYQAAVTSVARARIASDRKFELIQSEQERAHVVASEKRKAEIAKSRAAVEPVKAKAVEKRDTALAALLSQNSARRTRVTEDRVRGRAQAEDAARREFDELEVKHQKELKENEERLEQQQLQTELRYRDARTALETRWSEGLVRIQSPIEEQTSGGGGSFPSWDDPAWQNWKAPKTFPTGVRFGELQVDLKKVIDGVPREGEFTLPIPDVFTLPGQLTFPDHGSLLIEAGRSGREDAIRALQMLMMRLLTSLPPGRVHFTIMDPVSLGRNFAGFMHLADYDEALIGTRIWTDGEQIERRLNDLTEHMETVIQKYLRNEFETIDDYNAQAGELSEPYRVLVFADFPNGMQGDAFKRISSIASSGARCGVYTLLMRDNRVSLPSGVHMDDIEAHSVVLQQAPEKPGEPPRFLWKDDVFRQFPLTIDPPPSEEFLTRLLNEVGRKAKESKRVEVPFDTIAPKPDELWSLSTKDEVRVPIGRMGATRLQMMRLGKGVAQHAVIAGKTGSGKSTLLHAIITNLAMWHSPDEVEFYLVDFKKGVEFKTYASHALPHARVIAVESDREFGISVLQRLDAELTRRGDLYRKAGVQDVSSYRASAGAQSLPRTLLIVDEFQELFSEDDKLSQDASLLIDRLVRQGRAFGVHVILGSQTIGGSSGLSRSTYSQMAVRVALMLSEADSQLILGDNNSAARLLSRPGEAIYNDAGGLVENNSPFQIAWLGDEQKDRFLARIEALDQKDVAARGRRHQEPIVFEGNAPADVLKNHRLVGLLKTEQWPPASTAPPIGWFGEPVAIKDPTGVTFRRQSGANVLFVGQQEEGAMALMASSIISLASQLPPGGVSFRIFDGSAADSPLAAVLPRVKSVLPHDVQIIEYRAVDEAMAELGAELKKRQESSDNNPPPIFVLIYGLQRYRGLRKQEESFSFSSSDEPKPVSADKVFADLIREGPTFGMHMITWCDTPVSVERTLDRAAMREFDNRVLFQMSANDSSNLIDSPAANKLGANRALAYSEEQGTMEKFRPYALPSTEWLDTVKRSFESRPK